MSAIKYYALIVAGGAGSRMQSDVPKQFLLLKGKPVVMHTIEAFHSSSFNPEIILVLNSAFHKLWEELCIEHNFDIAHRLVAGGQQRFHSVKNGLSFINGDAVVAIHDAVRPCVNNKLIDSAYKQAEQTGSAVTAIKSRDSIRQKKSSGSISLNRENIYLVQTPQVFTLNLLRKAYTQEFSEDFTDDASVVERSGSDINLLEGNITNIKITYPDDIRIAEIYLDLEK